MLNRLSGLFIALFGVLLLIWVIPNHTETADYGWLRPATLPNIMSICMIILGLFHFVFPTGKAELDGALTLRFLLIFLLCLVALLLIKYIGFVFVAPGLAMIVMFLIGERRPKWLLTGIIIIPVSLWAIVVFVLERPLP